MTTFTVCPIGRDEGSQAFADPILVHMIPKPNETEGLGVGWPSQNVNKEKLQQLLEEIKAKM